jgi:hypothetical protein
MKNKFTKKQKSHNDITAEEPAELGVRPSNKPLKQDIDSQKLDNIKTNRLQAYRLMKKKVLTKEELTNFANLNFNNEELNKQIHQNVYSAETGDLQSNPSDKKDLSLINQFEEFYKQKNDPENFPKISYLDNSANINNVHFNKNKNEYYEVKNRYILGASLNSKFSFCFDKNDKWIIYINQNLVSFTITFS